MKRYLVGTRFRGNFEQAALLPENVNNGEALGVKSFEPLLDGFQIIVSAARGLSTVE